MKKLLVFALLVAGLLGALPVSASVADLTALARYYPENTALFAAFRTDDAFFADLDGFLTGIQTLAPQAGAATSMLDSLDLLTLSAVGRPSFAREVRPWLGETGAAGMLQGAGLAARQSPPLLVAFSITDQEAAEAFVNDTLNFNAMRFRQENAAGETHFILPRDGITVIIRRDVLLVGTNDAIALLDSPDSLADSERFTRMASQLPAQDYGGILYTSGAGVEMLYNAISEVAMTVAPPVGSMTGTGDFMMGVDLLREGMFINVVAPAAGEFSTADATLAPLLQAGSISADFSRLIPGNAFLVVQGRDMNALIQAARASDEATNANLNTLSLSFFMATGMNIQTDVLDWMTGDYAVFVAPNPQASPDSAEAFDIGFMVEVTDGEAAQATLAGLRRALLGETETVNGVEVVVVPGTTTGAQDILMAATDEVMVIGTRNAVSYVLDPPRLISWLFQGADFAADEGDLLDNTSLAVYINLRGIDPYVPLLADAMQIGDEQVQAVVDAASMISLSMTAGDEGMFVYRLAWRF